MADMVVVGVAEDGEAILDHADPEDIVVDHHDPDSAIIRREAAEQFAAIEPVDPPPLTFTGNQLALIKRTLCPAGTTDDEFALFVAAAQRTRLDPFLRQLCMVPRWDRAKGQTMQTMVTIDGQRLISERSGKYAGMTPAYWCGPDGQWVDVWLKPEPPAAAKVGIYRSDFTEPVWSVALYEAYVAKTKEGKPAGRWVADPAGQLAKCAEALSRRKAFPQDLSGLYTPEEMAAVGVIEATPVPPRSVTTPASSDDDNLLPPLEEKLSLTHHNDLYVEKVKVLKSGVSGRGPWTLHAVTIAGKEYTTFDTLTYAKCERAHKENIPVQIAKTKTTPKGVELLEIDVMG